MEKDAKYFLVGLFVSAGLLALCFFSIWLAGSHDNNNYDRYTVYFTDAVSGLNEGAAVQYKGVAVGRVADIRLSETRQDLIKVDIEVEENTPISADTEVNLNMQGITGLVYVELRTEVGENTPVPRVEGERYPVLKGSGTNLAKLLQEIPEITRQVRDLAEKFNTLMSEENIASLTRTISNVETMSRDLNGLLSEANVASVSEMVNNFSASSRSIEEVAAKFEKTADEIDKAVASISKVVSKNESNINKFSQDGLEQITSMSRETRRMAESIRKIADKLNEDPSQLIYKPNDPGVEIPK